MLYLLVDNYRLPRAGGGRGMEAPPDRIITSGPYRVRETRLSQSSHFYDGLAPTLWSWFALTLRDEYRLEACFGIEYAAYGVPCLLDVGQEAQPFGAKSHGGPAEWQVPKRPQIQVVAAHSDDIVAKTYARHQADRASYLASRQYQALYEQAAPTRMRSVDVSMPLIASRCVASNHIPADEQFQAAGRLKAINAQLNATTA